MYANPPGSAHSVWDSAGFFLLAYAAPPNFGMSAEVLATAQHYTPVILDTRKREGNVTRVAAKRYNTGSEKSSGGQSTSGSGVYWLPLDLSGGLSATVLELQFSDDASSPAHAPEANYLLVLDGTCIINGETLTKNMLLVAKRIHPAQRFELRRSNQETDGNDDECRVLVLAFTTAAANAGEEEKSSDKRSTEANVASGEL